VDVGKVSYQSSRIIRVVHAVHGKTDPLAHA